MEKKTPTYTENLILGFALFASTIVVVFYAIINFFQAYSFQENKITCAYVFLCLVYPVIIFLSIKSKAISFLFSPYTPITLARATCLWANFIVLTLAVFYFNQVFMPYILKATILLYIFMSIFQAPLSFDSEVKKKSFLKISILLVSCCLLLIYIKTFLNVVFLNYSDLWTLLFHNVTQALFLMAVSVMIFYVLCSNRIQSLNSSKKILVFIVYLSPILLLDVESSFEIEHYNAYLGAAISVLHGKVPLLDIFCQYGLSYLIFTIAFLFLPNTYGTAALIVSGFNVLYLIALLAIFRTIIKNPYHFAVIGISTVFGAYFLLSVNPSVAPSVLAFRYLPPTVVLLFLLNRHEHSEKISPIYMAIFLFLNIMWSLEAFVFSLSLYGFFLFINAHKIDLLVMDFIKTMLCFILVSVIAAGVYWIKFHDIPNYLLYAKHVYSYVNPESGEMAIRMRYYAKDQYLYIPSMMLCVNFILLYFSLVYKKFNNSNQENEFKNLYLINFFSVIFMSYGAFRSSGEVSLSISFVPFILFLYMIRHKLDHAIAKMLCSFILSITCTALVAVVYLKVLYVEPVTGTINSGLMGHLVHPNQSWFDRFVYNISHFCTNRVLPSDVSAKTINSVSWALANPCTPEVSEEVRNIIDKWFKETDSILIFHNRSVGMLLENKKYHGCLSHPFTDELFPELINFNLKKCKKAIKEHDRVIIDKSFDLYEIEFKVLENINKDFDLIKIDETKHFIVMEIKQKDIKANRVREIPLYFIKKLSLNNAKIAEKIPHAMQGDNEDYDQILIDLGKIEAFNKVILNMYSLKKYTTSIQEGHTSVAFDLWVSDNGERWIRIYSNNKIENDNTNNPYREIDFMPVKSRYLKFNFVSEDEVHIQRIYVVPYNAG